MTQERITSEERQPFEERDFFAIAAGWHTRLEDDSGAAARAEFDSWMSADARHREAYRAVDRMWAVMGESHADPRILGLRRDALDAARSCRQTQGIFRFTSLFSRAAQIAAGCFGRRPLLAASVLFLASGAAIALLITWQVRTSVSSGMFSQTNRTEGGTFQTPVGERSTVVMSDGSTIILNTNSRVDINFSARDRYVRLVTGQAWFQVAKNPDKPFVVEVARERVTALGTAFDVRLTENSDTVQVTLVEGRVRVQPIQSGLFSLMSDLPRAADLEPGEALTLTRDRKVTKRNANLFKISGWRRGQVVFDDDTLADAAAEINRYSHTQIELADPSLASLRVSGVFAVGHSESFVETIVAHYGIRIAQRTERRIVLTAMAP
jgi:transmembrane sensor